MPSAPATLTLTSRAPGRDAAVAGGRVVAGDHAGHVRAVAERVEAAQVGVEGVLGEVGAADELAGAAERADADDAGVDDRDVDAGAGQGRALRADRGADGIHRGAGAGGAVLGLRLDRRGGVEDGILRRGNRLGVLAAGDGVGRERPRRRVLGGVARDLAGDVVGRLVRRGSRPAAGRSELGRGLDVGRRARTASARSWSSLVGEMQRHVAGDAADRVGAAQPGDRRRAARGR